MRQREEAPQAREDLDEPCGPSPIEYPYRCPVCGTELLVNEAIIDAGIGMAKFQNDYYPADIEQPLTGRNLIKPTDLFPAWLTHLDSCILQAASWNSKAKRVWQSC